MGAVSISKEKLEELELKHSEVKVVSTVLGDVALRGPTRGEYKLFRKAYHDDKKKPDATESMVRQCVVFPDSTEFAAMLDKKPGIADKCVEAVLELAGLTGEADSKP